MVVQIKESAKNNYIELYEVYSTPFNFLSTPKSPINENKSDPNIRLNKVYYINGIWICFFILMPVG